jgi:peptidoglycan/LPS O-acetylase OafA/YrhL
MRRIDEFEGLRGLLAWWVVMTHILGYSGIPALHWPGFKYLWNGETPVSVFIILSGFVIFYLSFSREETYGSFITRRFFRIYPVFLLCLALALLLDHPRQMAFAGLPWSGDQQVQQYLNDVRRVDDQIGAHIISHLTLLFGIIPDSILYRSNLAILPPAWSI